MYHVCKSETSFLASHNKIEIPLLNQTQYISLQKPSFVVLNPKPVLGLV